MRYYCPRCKQEIYDRMGGRGDDHKLEDCIEALAETVERLTDDVAALIREEKS